jgi:hypothetical protein
VNPTTNTSNTNHLTPNHTPNIIELEPRTPNIVPENACGLKLRETKARGQKPYANKIKASGGALGVSKYNLGQLSVK